MDWFVIALAVIGIAIQYVIIKWAVKNGTLEALEEHDRRKREDESRKTL